LNKGYLVKITSPQGYRVHRFEFTRWHVAGAAALLVVLVAAIAGYFAVTVRSAQAQVHELGRMTDVQHEQLTRMGHQAQALGDELQRLQTQNQQIRRLMGADRGPRPRNRGPRPRPAQSKAEPAQQTTLRTDAFEQVADRLTRLQSASTRARDDADGLRRLAMRVLNVHRLEELTRARVIAAIPSIDPVEGAGIASAFGWRLDPWPSYHEGVDLDANYGDRVRAAAAGTVASAGWDGGFGLKVDVDHGNGYHTWYAHLSRIDVVAGEYVRKAQAIALVGATGDATGPHLHYQVMFGGHVIDPTPFLSGVPAKVLASIK
jgi:murein DD-endopeptidase MepM/ murein hydrolase activator NlpD